MSKATLSSGDSLPGAEDQTRADLYRLLGTLLSAAPEADVLEVLQQLPASDDAAFTELTQALEELRSVAGTANPSQLVDEYFGLFIGLGKGELVPYASWYLTGYLMEQPLAELRKDLARLGFARQEEVAEPEDHAAALCEVMSLILAESALSFSEQQAFFDRHLRPWLLQFFMDLEQAEQADFYCTVARLGQAFMKIEQRYFAMLA
jgi:TorA maturation chaperone TorD